jgi:hypothetical protein
MSSKDLIFAISFASFIPVNVHADIVQIVQAPAPTRPQGGTTAPPPADDLFTANGTRQRRRTNGPAATVFSQFGHKTAVARPIRRRGWGYHRDRLLRPGIAATVQISLAAAAGQQPSGCRHGGAALTAGLQDGCACRRIQYSTYIRGLSNLVPRWRTESK